MQTLPVDFSPTNEKQCTETAIFNQEDKMADEDEASTAVKLADFWELTGKDWIK
jgi:hypothetical protein